MPMFRKKPVVIEAIQLRWDTWSEMCGFAGVGKMSEGNPEGTFVDSGNLPINTYPSDFHPNSSGPSPRIGIYIPTLEGVMVGVENDWIIKGVKGELYPCKPDIFDATYEPVEVQS